MASRLESLGFEVERPRRNPPWAEEELILALDLYLRAGLLDAEDQAVTDLSRDLNALPVHTVESSCIGFDDDSEEVGSFPLEA